MTRHRVFFGLMALTALLALAACGGGAKAPSPTIAPSSPPGATPAPSGASPSPGTRATPASPAAPEIQLPNGFAAFLAADGLSSPTSLTLDSEGRLYVSEQGGTVWRLSDENGDGAFETRDPFVQVTPQVTGIALASDGALYISSTGRVTSARDLNGDGAADDVHDVVSGLPNGRHQNNGLAFGPDGFLYFTNGSTCNECQEADPRSAAILRLNPDGSGLEVYAHGLRNSYDLTFTPDGRLWATDNGSDPPCNTIDELNLIVQGGDYGWPYSPGCDALAKGIPPVANLGFNTSSDGLVYYDASAFPSEYRGSFFVAQFGANRGDPNIGKRVVSVKVRETPQGPADEVTDFALGLNHPLDVTVDRDGSLLVADYGSGKVYRIVYLGG